MTPTEESPTHQPAQRQQQPDTIRHHQHPYQEMIVPPRVKLVDVNEYMTCHLCQGYLIDATTITECLHAFCRSCILKFLQDNSHCPVCDLVINTAKPNLKPDKSMQDVVYKLVPELFLREMERRRAFYRAHLPTTTNAAVKLTPEQRGEDTERTIFNAKEMFSLSLEYASEDNSLIHSPITGGHLAAAVAPRTREEHVRSARTNNGIPGTGSSSCSSTCLEENGNLLRRYLYCPGMCRIDVLKKFVSTKYNVNCTEYYIDILYKRVPLPGHYTLIDIAYIYSWKRNAPMKFFFRISDLSQAKDNCEYYIPLTEFPIALSTSNENIVKSSAVKPTKKTVTKSRMIKTPDVVENKKNGTAISSRNKNVQNKAEVLVEFETSKKEMVSSNNKKNEPVENTHRIIEIKSEMNENVAPPQVKQQSEVLEPPLVKHTPPTNNIKNETLEENQKSLEAVKDAKVNPPEPPIDKSNLEKPQQKPFKLIINVPKHLTTPMQQESTSPQNTTNTSTISSEQNMQPAIKTTKSSPTKSKTVQAKSLPNSPTSAKSVGDITVDEEKQNFLKSFQLAARNNLPPSALVKSPPGNNIANEMKQYKLATEIKQIKPLPAIVPSLASSTTPLQKLVLKRKQTSHLNKLERQQKRSKSSNVLKSARVAEYPKIAPKVLTSPPIETVKEIIQNFKTSQQDSTTGNQMTTTKTTPSALQSLFGNCNINIPSSLSITLKETTADTVMTPIKPVINHIEILKLPDSPLLPPTDINGRPTTSEEASAKISLDRLDVSVSTITVPTVNSQATTTKVGVHPNLPAKVTMPANSKEIKTAPMNSTTTQGQRPAAANLNSSSFQKMFEEAIKKPEFTQKIHAYPVKQLKEDFAGTTASSELLDPISPIAPANTCTKRNLMEIASQLAQSKKSKIETIASIPATPPLAVSQQVSTTTTTTTTSRPVAIVPMVNANGKVAIPRLPANWKSSPSSSATVNSLVPQQKTVANLHSASLGINYTVSINQLNNNGTINAKVNLVESPKSSPKHVSSSVVPKAKSPSQSNGVTATTTSYLPQMSYRELTATVEMPKPSLNSVKSRHPIINGNVPLPPKVSSPRISTSTSPNISIQDSNTNGLSPLNLKSSNSDDDIIKIKKPSPISRSPGDLVVPKISHNLPSQSTDTTPINSKPTKSSPQILKPNTNKKKVSKHLPQKRHPSPNNNGTTNHNNIQQQPATAAINPNDLLEKYNIQNLAQLTAGWNLGTQLMSMAPPSAANHQLAFQQAMLLKHFEIQNRQNWLNNTNPLMAEYKKYLQQTLNAAAAAAAAQQQQATSASAQKQQALNEN